VVQAGVDFAPQDRSPIARVRIAIRGPSKPEKSGHGLLEVFRRSRACPRSWRVVSRPRTRDGGRDQPISRARAARRGSSRWRLTFSPPPPSLERQGLENLVPSASPTQATRTDSFLLLMDPSVAFSHSHFSLNSSDATSGAGHHRPPVAPSSYSFAPISSSRDVAQFIGRF